MAREKHKLLQIPQGTETFYLDEASRHHHLRRRLESLFDSWGYLPVQTPVFDFYDTYQPLISKDRVEDTYRLFDRKGELLMLRSDITLFLAKQMGVILEEKDLPIRVSYSDSILRHQHSEDISRQEFFQVGAELIGQKGTDADLEILLLLVENLEQLEIPSSWIHLGSHRIFDALFGSLEETTQTTISKAIRQRNWQELTEILEEAGMEAPKLVELLRFVGTPQEAQSLWSQARQDFPQAAEGFTELEAILQEIEFTGKGDWFRVDFSEIGEQPYYTGVVFKVYTEGISTNIASGGRYDKLLGYFGFDTPSVGFSLFLRKVEPFIDLPAPAEALQIGKEESFAQRYQKAQLLRGEGKKVIL